MEGERKWEEEEENRRGDEERGEGRGKRQWRRRRGRVLLQFLYRNSQFHQHKRLRSSWFLTGELITNN